MFPFSTMSPLPAALSWVVHEDETMRKHLHDVLGQGLVIKGVFLIVFGNVSRSWKP